MKKVLYSALYGGGHPFDTLVEEVRIANKPTDMTEQDSMLVVWGGSDISPKLYNHPQSKTTHPYPERDRSEWALMQRAKDMGIPIIGVCRGAQMLCALAGGFLIQDVRGHAGRHPAHTVDGTVIQVNSIHHQMMAGYENLPHELLAWSSTPLSPRYIYKDDQEYLPPNGFVEAEFIYFPEVKGYAIQWHPEMMAEESQATQFVFSKIKLFNGVEHV